MLAIADVLEAQGVSRYKIAPPLYRLVWRLGVNAKPPIYQSFGMLVLSNGVPFAVTMAILRILFPPLFGPSSIRKTIFVAGLAGLIYGLGMAYSIGRQSKRVQLPPLIV